VNVLVTNTRNSQAYTIIRALRPYAKKIVATMEGDNQLASWFSHAARSRLVDRRYFTPSPVADWRAGRIQRENTKKEENYIQTVLRICEQEKIDTIFPSFDPHVYVFSKNKEKFERLGVVIPIPDYETILTPMDKYRTIQAAQEVGFPCPKTYLVEREEDLKRPSEDLGFPLVVKPRLTAGGRGTEIVGSLPELLEKIHRASEPSFHMIQEYIPGKQEDSIVLVLGRDTALKMTYADRRVRALERLTQDFATASESLGCHTCTLQAVKLGQEIRWCGSMTVQVKIDSRDGVPKLMEINPRMGYGLWRRVAVGINEPLMCVKIFQGEEVEVAKDYPAGTMFLYPLEDLLGLGLKLVDLLIYKFRVEFQGRRPVNPLNPPPSVKELIQAYKKTYFNRKKKLYNFYFIYFFNDPLASTVWWLQTLSAVWRAAKKLGK
jgi:biotin carboxylase